MHTTTIPQPKVSVLGDSISTFGGISPADGVYYHADFALQTGVASPEDTWWQQVITALGGTLLVNHSYAGSSICRDGYQPASSPWRLAKLRQGDTLPDVILIWSGLNDVASYRKPEAFGQDYRDMLATLQAQYPQAQIHCGTLCEGVLPNPYIAPFMNFKQCTPLGEYNAEIRVAVAEAGAVLIDLAQAGVRYASLDGVHPKGEGMGQIARAWLNDLRLTQA